MARPKAHDKEALTPIGERIMRAADEAGFTQTSLERAAHFSQGYMHRLLHRPQDRIDMTKLETLSDLLGVRMHWLATGREPMREGGPRTPVEEGMVVARGLGVTEDVFWFVRTRDEDVERDAAGWARAFLEENQKRVEDEAYARMARRVAMSDSRKKQARKESAELKAPPESASLRKSHKVA